LRGSLTKREGNNQHQGRQLKVSHRASESYPY